MKKNRKHCLLFLVLIIGIMISISSMTVNAAVSLNKTSISLAIPKTYQLKVLGTSQKVSWSSTNKTIATVSANGVVKAVKKGTCYITAKVGTRKYNCKVTIKQPVTSIKLNKTSAIINKGSSITLVATVLPTNANNKSVTWKCSNTKVATVSKTGYVKGIAKGTVTITATANDGSGKKASCKIIVKQPATSVKINKTSATVTKGKSITLTATVSPSSANVRTVTWKSSNTNVATVSSSGIVKGLAVGTVTITAFSKDNSNLKASCKVTVKNPETTSFKITKQYLDIDQNQRRYFAYVEVLNTGNTGLYMKDAIFDFEDNTGSLIEREDSCVYASHEILPPNEKGYFYMGFGYSSLRADINLNNGFILKPTIKLVKATGTTVSYRVSDVKPIISTYGWLEVIGRLTNDTTEDAGYLYLVAIIYDKNGNVLAISGTSIIDLDAKSTISFSDSFLGYSNIDINNIGSINVIAQKTYYQFD